MFNLQFGTPDLGKWKIFSNLEFNAEIVLAHIFGLNGENGIFINCLDEVFAVGYNYSGCLAADETIHQIEDPKKIEELSYVDVVGICTGTSHGLVYTQDGRIYSWGCNAGGQLGNGTTRNRYTPEIVQTLENEHIINVTAGGSFSVALSVKYEVWIWGEIEPSKMLTIPVKFQKEEDIVYITSGMAHVIALSDSGKIYSWGNNEDGKLGHGNKTALSELKMVNMPDKIIKVACGRDCTIAIDESGNVYAWGNNYDGCLGIGGNKKAVLTPTIVQFREPITDIAGSIYHQLLAAQNEDTGHVFVWGKCNGVKFSYPQSVHCYSLYDAFCDISTPVSVKMLERNSDSEEDGSYASLNNSDFKLNNSVKLIERSIPANMFNNQEMSDITIRLGGDNCINAHKVVLNFFSEHFRKMFQDQWKDGGDNSVIDMSNYNAVAYSAYIKFVYFGVLEELEATDLFDLYLISNEYEETVLPKECLKILKTLICVENVAILFACAWKNRCQEMIDMCINESAQSFDDIILTPGFSSFTNEERLFFCQLTATERKSQNLLTKKCKSMNYIF